MAEKFCIFCGKKPENKNLEHVIPQWLIKMTGREHKDVYVNKPKDAKHIPFIQFKFPACTECNTKYSKMEAAVKPIMETVLRGGSLQGSEISLLLDWFDKVRVGLWLVNMCFDANLKEDVYPHFFIDTRVAKTDRMLSIKKIDLDDPSSQGILFNGTESELFKYCPSAFTMVINNYYFFNASNNNLVSPRVGFPGLKNIELHDAWDGVFKATIAKGSNKVANPIIQSFVPSADSVTFYQPIYRDYLSSPTFPKDDYVINHSYDESKGLGGIFAQKGFHNNIRYMNPDDKFSIKLKEIKMPNLISDLLSFQNAIAQKSIGNSPEMDRAIMINKMQLDILTRQK